MQFRNLWVGIMIDYSVEIAGSDCDNVTFLKIQDMFSLERSWYQNVGIQKHFKSNKGVIGQRAIFLWRNQRLRQPGCQLKLLAEFYRFIIQLTDVPEYSCSV